MYSIIKQRNKASSFISMVLQNIQFKIKVKHLLDKLEENYMIISSFSRCESLYFNIIYDIDKFEVYRENTKNEYF